MKTNVKFAHSKICTQRPFNRIGIARLKPKKKTLRKENFLTDYSYNYRKHNFITHNTVHKTVMHRSAYIQRILRTTDLISSYIIHVSLPSTPFPFRQEQ